MSEYSAIGRKSFLTTAGVTAYRLVTLSSAGVAANSAAADDSVGIAMETVAASTDGKPASIRLLNDVGSFTMVASGAISRNAPVYCDTGGKVTATPQGKVIGIANEAATADLDEIEVINNVSYPSGTILYISRVASSNVTNDTAETSFGQSFTFPANTLRVGDCISIFSQGIAPTTNSTDTLNVKAKIGSTIIAATGAVNVADNDIWKIDARVVIRTAGASGTLVAAGSTALGVEGTVTDKPAKLASTTVDTTAAQLVTITGTWSVASTSDIARQDVLIIRKN